jgi:ligand-binding SRPBCC domain-containing protein
VPLIRIETVIRAPIEYCFDLMRDVAFHVRSTKATGERVVAGKNSGLLSVGDEVTFEARHLGFRQRLTVRVTICERPHLFEDVMVRGAFSSMRHVHRFFESKGATRMVDEFSYVAPWGALGRAADFLFLESYLRRFLTARAEALKSAAEDTAT